MISCKNSFFFKITDCIFENMFKEEAIKASTLEEMAKAYNVERRTLYNWLLPIRQELLDIYPVKKKYLSFLMPKQRKLIIEFLG